MKKIVSLLVVLAMLIAMVPAVFAAGETATLVTDASSLAVGDQIIIVASEYDYAIGTNQKSNNRGAAAVTKSGDTATYGDDVQVLTLEAGTTDGTWAFNTGSGYLYAASSSKNYLRTETSLSANSSWSISIADGVASVVAQGSNTRGTLQFNNGDASNLLFSCYSSASQKAVSIYKIETTTEGGEDPTPEEPTPEEPTPEEPSVPTYEVVAAPEAGVAYKFGMVQENVSTTDVYYLTGAMNGYYMDTTTDAAASADVYLEETDGGYYLYTYVEGAKKYINMVVSGTHVNGAFEDAASTVYTYDSESLTVVATVNEELYWFGTRNDKTYTTVGPVKTSYNGFYCKFYVAPTTEGGDDNTGDDNTGDDNTGDDTTTPTYEVVTAPEAGSAYKFGMVQENVSTTDVYYLTGAMNGYYMDTTTDAAASADVYLEETDGGYYLYTYVDGAKKYINMVVSGTHVNGAFEDAASTVYTYDSESLTVVATVNEELYWFGTRNDKTYTTVGPVKTSYNGFYCKFYAAPTTEGGEGGNEETLPSGTLEIEAYGNIEWTAPATGTVKFTINIPGATLAVLNGFSPLAEGTDSVTVNVTEGVTYGIYPGYDVTTASVVTWEYVEGGSGDEGGDTPADVVPNGGALALGDNNVTLAYATMPMMASNWTFTATENGYVTVTVVSVNGNTDLGMGFGRGAYTLIVGETDGQWTNTVTVYMNANETVNIAVLDTADFNGASAVINVAFEAGEQGGGEGGETTEPDGSFTNPYPLTSDDLPYNIEVTGNHDIYYTFTNTTDAPQTIKITYGDGALVSGLPGDAEYGEGYYLVTVGAGESIQINPWTMSPAEVDYVYTITVYDESEGGGDVTPPTYSLIGYINGADYGCEGDSANPGEYIFVDGTVTVTFTQNSYVFVKTTDNVNWYMTNGWLGEEVTEAVLYDTTTAGIDCNKLFVPAGEVTFTLVENEDGTLTLSYTVATEGGEGGEGEEGGVVAEGTDVTVKADEPVYEIIEITTDGILSVTVGENVKYQYATDAYQDGGYWEGTWNWMNADAEFEVVAGETYTFRFYCYYDWATQDGTVTYSITFTPAEVEVQNTPYEWNYGTISEPGEYAMTMVENTNMTVVEFCPTETGVYTITGAAIAKVGDMWVTVEDPEWVSEIVFTCTSVGQSIIIGYAEDQTITVTKTGEYEAPAEIELQTYENNAADLALTYEPEMGQCDAWTYIDIYDMDATITAVKGEDGYYHLNSAEGPILMVDVEHIITLDAALYEGRGVMYAYVYDENGELVEKWDIGNAVKEYMAAAEDSETGFIPLTDDLIFFYDVYGHNAGWYMDGGSIFDKVTSTGTEGDTETTVETVTFNAENAWMFACLYVETEHTYVDGVCSVCGDHETTTDDGNDDSTEGGEDDGNEDDEPAKTGDNTLIGLAAAAALLSAMSIAILPKAKKFI